MFINHTSKVESALVKAIDRAAAIIHFNPNGTIIDANDIFLGKFGYNLQEVQGKHHSIFCDPHYTQSDEYKNFWRNLKNGHTQSSEYKRFTKDGNPLWIQATYNAVKNSQGNVIRVVKVAQDITQDKARRDENQLLSLALNQTVNAVIITDNHKNIEYVNDGFTKMSGYKFEEVKGKEVGTVLFSSQTSQDAKDEFLQAYKQGESMSTEIVNHHKSGTNFWTSLSLNPIKGDDGKLLRFIIVQSDITQTKEKSLEANSLLEAINRSQAMISFTPEGNILDANRNFLDALGYEYHEIIGKHHRIFVDPADANSPDYSLFWEKLRSGQYDKRVYKRLTKNNVPIWIQASYNPIIDSKGQVVKIIKYATEMTEVIKIGEIAEITSSNIQNIAAALEELSSSFGEISSNMTMSKNASDAIKQDTIKSKAAAEQLTNSMKVMENIVQLINGIAGQVNLLALNATIEAARAGESGKGFAVVAGEVKNLANQTTDATEEISKQIRELQKVSLYVADSVNNIAEAAETMNQYVASTASAVEEQSTVSRDISGNTQKMTDSVKEIAKRIIDLSLV